MAADAHAAADFYATPRGAVAARLLRERLALLWPDLHGQSVLGIGFTAPYLRLWREDAARCIALTPAQMGATRWPAGAPSLSCTAEEDALPFPDLMFDRVLLVHGLEAAESARRLLRETWRVLKDDGRLLVVAPNRSGMWAYWESTPFGHGQPVFVRPDRPAAGGVAVSGGAAGHRAAFAAVELAAGAAQRAVVRADRAEVAPGLCRCDDHRGGEGHVCRDAGRGGAAAAAGAGGGGVNGRGGWPAAGGNSAMICDVHAHYIPKAFSDFMGDRFSPRVGVPERLGIAKHPVSDSSADIQGRLELMDAAGVETQILSPHRPPYLPDEASACRRCIC